MGAHERFFRMLLRLYPRGFREAYGEEMAALFRRRLDRSGGAGRVRLWWRTVADAAVTAVALRRSPTSTSSAAPPAPLPERREDRMDTLLQDIRHAVRRLTKAPGFALGAIALLAVGIGVNASVFTLADALLFRAPPWSEPERVVFVYQDSDDGEPSSSSYPATRDMAESEVFAAVAAISPTEATWEGPDGPTAASIEFVTASYLDAPSPGTSAKPSRRPASAPPSWPRSRSWPSSSPDSGSTPSSPSAWSAAPVRSGSGWPSAPDGAMWWG
jgi:hypothetical protein